MVIHTIEMNLRQLFGDSFYSEIKKFYMEFILAKDVDKVLITRRSYVLYKIFYMIFSLSAEDEKFQKDLKEGAQCVYTSHSLPLLLGKNENRAVLIVDDIIVNGRTILNVIKKFSGKNPNLKINVWCLRCNIEAAFLPELKPFLKHVIYVSPYEWEIVSDRLNDAVVMSNVGYVSFLKTYWLSEDLYNKLLKHLVNAAGDTDKIAHKKEKIETHSQGNEGVFSLECDYFFLEKCRYNSDYRAAIRLYKGNASYLAIPYVFLPRLTSEELLSLCRNKQNKECGYYNKDVKEIVRYFSQYWTAQDIEDCPDVGVFAYQAAVCFLSGVTFHEIVNDLNLMDSSDCMSENIKICFDSQESFSTQENREKCLENLRNELCSREKAIYLERPTKEEQNCLKEIAYCQDVLASSCSKNDSFFDSMKKYVTTLRKKDDLRAKNQKSRLYGISVDNIVEWFTTQRTSRHLNDSAEYYLGLLYLWDSGLAACVILPSWDPQKKALVFSEFNRHGEQAFRALYSMYPNEYSLLRRFAEITDAYAESEIYPFSLYCANSLPSLNIIDFLKQVEFQTFFADCLAVSPKSVGATLSDTIVNKIIASYRKRI